MDLSTEKHPARSIIPSTLAMFLIGAAEVATGPMTLQMGEHFGVPSARISWLPACYCLVYAAIAPLMGPLSDRIGRKRLLVPGLVGFGCALASIAGAPSFAAAMTGSTLAGLCSAAIQPNALAIVNDTVPERRQARAMGTVFLGLTGSFVAMPALSAMLATRVHWRATYLLMGALALLTAALVVRLPLPRPTSRTQSGFISSFRAALGIAGVRRRLAATFLWLGLSIGITTVMAEVLRRRFHLTTEPIGWAIAGFGLATMAGNRLIERIDRMFPSRNHLVLAGIAVTIAGCLVVCVLPRPTLAGAGLAALLWALAYGSAGPIHHLTLAQSSPSLRGTITAIHVSLLNFGIVLVGFLSGRLFDSLGVEVVVGLLTGGMAAGWLLYLSMGLPRSGQRARRALP